MSNNGKGLGLGIVLLSAGIVWLLAMADIVTLSTLKAVFMLWPLILVAIGISIIFKKNGLVKLAVWFTLLAVIIGYGYFAKPSWNYHIFNKRNVTSNRQVNSASSSDTSVDSSAVNTGVAEKDASMTNEDGTAASVEHIVIEKVPQTEKAELSLKFGAAQISLDANTENNNLIEANQSKSLAKHITHSEKMKDSDRQASIEFKMDRFDITDLEGLNKFSSGFHLNKDVLWRLDLDTGAVNSNLDLSGLKVEKLNIDTGASSFNIIMSSCNTELKINAGDSKF